ncbi:MAG: MFS transporter [Dehalococcoidales bacterium]|nr:MFS transporter [Dehalococcoidales bacterium]
MIKRTINGSRHSGRRKVLGLNPNVFFLGLVSLLTDISSEMIFTLVPLFLANVLCAATTVIGFIGGLSESADAIFRIVSGWFSDRIGRRKPLALAGYSISTLAKPFMYLASNWGVVAAIRFGDRIGKGIRSSPRDALVADSVSYRERGRGFGLQRAMDTTGAAIGLVIAAVIIYQVQGGGLELGLETYQWLVLVGTIPAVLAILVLLFFIRERRRGMLLKDDVNASLISGKLKNGFDVRFKLFLAVMAIFTLGNSSDFFVILRAQDLETPLIQVTLMLVLFNITYAAVSWPAGILSDKLGRRGIIAIGWAIYALVYLGFALSSSLWQIWLLFAAYGIYYGIVEGVARAFVADLVPAERRGTAYGLYHGVVGLTLLPASLIAGWLWDTVNPAAPFYLGAGLAFLAMLGLMGLVRE